MEKIGLIAGNRRFPFVFADAARAKSVSVVAVGIRGDADPKLAKHVARMYWVGLRDFGTIPGLFKAEGVSKVVMAGQISPYRLFSKEVQQDKRIQELLSRGKDRKANSIFSGIADMLAGEGIELVSSATFLEELLPGKGVLTSRKPSADEWEQVNFGAGIACAVAGLDIGLAVAVREKAVVAVEALEGTDNLIRRAGKISRGGFVLVKVARPAQDMRFDLPVIGLKTVQTLIRARASCLAIEAGKTMFLDMAAALRLANKHNLAIVAIDPVKS